MPPHLRCAALTALIAAFALSSSACAENKPAASTAAEAAAAQPATALTLAATPPGAAAKAPVPSAATVDAKRRPSSALPAESVLAPAQIASAAGAAPTAGVAAQPAPKSSPFVVHNETLPEAVAQADGITNAVTDRLWLATDHFWHHGDYYRIVSLLRVCVEVDPTWTDAYGDGAWLLWSLGDTAGADRFLKYGVSRRPELWDLEYEFGWHLYNTKRYADALPYLKSATQNKNADAVAWKMLAHCFDKLGRTADSVATWQQVVKRFPNDPAGPHNLEEMQAKQHGAPATAPTAQQPAAPSSPASPPNR